jgi:peptidoglycan/xylan/chitin deacetylase (PgdA/CDA1 family)
MTIDDFPSVDFVRKIELLISHNIPAILFGKGEAMEDNPGVIQHAIRQGFVIGNHGYRHLRYSSLSLEQASEEIMKADRLIEDAYHETGIARPMKVFRFPYGDKGGVMFGPIQKL